MVTIPTVVTAAWLNSLDDEERIEVARSDWAKRFQCWVRSHVTFLWWRRLSPLGVPVVNNGSAFFLGLGERLFAVTAAHVLEGYRREKSISAGRIHCWLGNLPFDPETRLQGYRPGVDIATFELSYDELTTIGKQAILSMPENWPPPHPFSGQGAYLAGFPGVSRVQTGTYELNFGLYTAFSPVNAAGDQRITCPFDRRDWIDTLGEGLPPEGMPLGGMSGGPLLLPLEQDGAWSLQLAGVISQARTEGFETVVSVPAHFIAFDGTIRSEHSRPVQHAVPASAEHDDHV